jgi:hypothetical protein
MVDKFVEAVEVKTYLAMNKVNIYKFMSLKLRLRQWTGLKQDLNRASYRIVPIPVYDEIKEDLWQMNF